MANDPEILLELIEFLLRQLESTLHIRDSALQVLMEHSDWRELLRAQQDDQFRRSHTDELVQALRRVIRGVADGEVSSAELAQVAAKLQPSVH